jgi:hypothetical protein
MKLGRETLRQMINEEADAIARKKRIQEAEVLALDAARKRKQVKDYEKFIAPFFNLWDSGLEALPHARNFIPEGDRAIFDKLVSNFRQSGSDLSVFLRSLRLRMMKGGK